MYIYSIKLAKSKFATKAPITGREIKPIEIIFAIGEAYKINHLSVWRLKINFMTLKDRGMLIIQTLEEASAIYKNMSRLKIDGFKEIIL